MSNLPATRRVTGWQLWSLGELLELFAHALPDRRAFKFTGWTPVTIREIASKVIAGLAHPIGKWAAVFEQ